MKQKQMRFFASVLALFISMTSAAHAVDWQISKSKTATPTVLDESNTQTDISLQLPAADFQRTIDVVLVMDKSSSGKARIKQFIDNSEALINQLHTKAENNDDIDIRVAVIKYRGNAYDMVNAVDGTKSGLVSIKTSADTDTVINALKLDEGNSSFFSFANGEDRGTGSNIHAGIQLANNILTADTATLPGDKYMLLYTDGLGYLWNDENGVPKTIYTQVVMNGKTTGLAYDGYENGVLKTGKFGGDGMPNADQRVANDKYPSAGSSYIPDGVTPLRFASSFDPSRALDMFEAMMETNNMEFTSTSPYESNVIFNGHAFSIANENVVIPNSSNPVGDDAKAVTGLTIVNAVSLPDWTSLRKYYKLDSYYCVNTPYLQSNPYEVVEVNGEYYYANVDNGNGTYSYDPSVPSDTQHFIVNDDYFMLHATSIEKGTYMAAKEFDEMVDAGYHCATFYYDNSPTSQEYYLGNGLRQYLASRSDYSSNSQTTADMTAAFADMRTDMNYLIAEGTVTDPIPADFELVTDRFGTNMPFEVTCGGVSQTPNYDGTKWTFGAPNGGVYPYEVSFDASTKVITFDINVPIDTSEPVVLNYALDLQNGVSGNVYPTNGTTTLNYTDGVGNSGTENFEVPSVTYGAAELSLRTVTDTGFYCDEWLPEADATTNGAMAITAYINNYPVHKDNISAFGFYIKYEDNDSGEIQLTAGQDSINWNKAQNYGAFYSILYKIPFADFSKNVIVKPFLIKNDMAVVTGDPVSVSVTGTDKWLGSESVMLQNHSTPKIDED